MFTGPRSVDGGIHSTRNVFTCRAGLCSTYSTGAVEGQPLAGRGASFAQMTRTPNSPAAAASVPACVLSAAIRALSWNPYQRASGSVIVTVNCCFNPAEYNELPEKLTSTFP